jgi:predicted RNA-binding Zn-ribbon protein involved in translation (DUF1610 family)
MLDLLSTQNQLHTRLVDFTLQEYMFVLQVVLGERLEVAYANTFDTAEYKRNVPSEEEEEYLASKRKDAEIMLEQQNCRHLREYLEQEYRSDIQEQASTLKDFKFTGSEVQKLLNNLLHERSQELSEASVRDILALIKSMYDSGALDSGDSFQNHFITIPNKYNALCLNCSHEFYATEGLSMKCPNCGAVYNWDEQQRRFIPEIPHL